MKIKVFNKFTQETLICSKDDLRKIFDEWWNVVKLPEIEKGLEYEDRNFIVKLVG